ncbi:hypothetical protein [Parasphaerochaeta coccoides]|uniref:Capsule assembly Wzi family protein n=1 Tax=Parasphaerochaeta coccoides (strain ATCC BAA-1237 / DSM 17374 / SPN1) TaxID=760011 RepID=F4GI83_PARC1|nr:hypothetical protein [Parasphaerochaeta coccoides]AEC02681.1 hypothetical protein Spico_1478 [Parasphaerochaeta coccoides DSM 17374]
MKKKIILVCVCLLLAMQAVFSARSGNQKIYPVDSEVYEAISHLYIAQGLALPSSAGPWSKDELLRMLEKIDPARLEGTYKNIHDFAAGELGTRAKIVRFGLDAAVEAYVHTNTVDFVNEEDWIRGFDQRKPFLDIVLETNPHENIYGYSSLSLGNVPYTGSDSATRQITSIFFGQKTLTTNIIMIPPASMTDFDLNVPYRAFGAFGGYGWSVEIGRDKVSWGPGKAGNFVVGDHLKYHNQGRFTTYSKNFKYTFLTSFFPHPGRYYSTDETPVHVAPESSQTGNVNGLNMFMGHRLEWRLFGDKVGLTITEGMMYQSEENTLDLRILNPAMIFHDYYIRSFSNSIISLEVDYTPIRNLNIYGQVVVDEFSLPGEPVPGKDEWAFPNAFGFMLGVQGNIPLGIGILYGGIEAVKTDPFLYLRYNSGSDTTKEHGLNYVVATRYFDKHAVYYAEDFLGYKYGGDAIVLNGNIGLKNFGTWEVEASLFHMIHGTFDKWTAWSEVNNGTPSTNTVPFDPTPTESHPMHNYKDDDAHLRDIRSYTTIVGLKGSYRILPGLMAYGQMDYIHVKNPGNISTNAPINDFQVTLGVSYSL